VDVHIRGRRIIERLIDRKTGLRSGRNRIFPKRYSLASIWRSGRTEVLATFEAEMSWL
jgi:hypothetical protein